MRALSALLAASFAAVALASGVDGGAATAVAQGSGEARAPGVKRVVPKVARAAVARRAADDARFGFALQRRLGARDESVILSPYSVTHAFALARGETREQLARALRFPLDGDRLHPALNALDRAIESRARDGLTIATANAAWGVAGYAWNPRFLTILARHHGAGMRTADFAGDEEGAVRAIDAFVREATRDRISNLITPEDLNPFTRLVLVNAAYLDAEWVTPFPANDTRDRPFHAPSGTVQVRTMHNDLDVPTASGRGWRAADVPYQGGRVSMLIVLPDVGDLADVERRLARGLLPRVVGLLEEERIGLALPRFRIESTHELIPPLAELGVKDAFSDRGDFSGMTRSERVQITGARQKAFIDVFEKGTEAAAATGIVAGPVSAPPPAEPFVVDRPFLFAIRDRPTGTVLFSGRVLRP